MPYIDRDYYEGVYKASSISYDVFDTLVERASDTIDMVTSYKLHGVDLESEAPLIRDNVKKATAAQIEYMVSQGGEHSIHGVAPSSVNIGNFSYQEGAGKGIVSPAVIAYLKPTGLLYSGLNVYGR